MNMRMLKKIKDIMAEGGSLSVYQIRDKLIDAGVKSVPSITQLSFFLKKFFKKTENNEWIDEKEE